MIEQEIYQIIKTKIDSSHIEILNESHMHSGNRTDTHFKLVVVSEKFKDISLVKRHQLIYKEVADLFNQGLKALALHCYTAEEYDKSKVIASPNCVKKHTT